MKSIVIRVLAIACSLLVVEAAGTLAQAPARLGGSVRDQTGRPLSGAQVTIAGGCLPTPRTVVTANDGRYTVDALSPGSCNVTITLSGFESRTVAMTIEAPENTLDLALAIAALSEGVTVTATRTGAADVQSTPVAITVLPGATLERMGVQTVGGLAGVAPSVTVWQPVGGAQVIIRGIGTNSAIVGADPSSTVHLDGVYLARPAMVFAHLLNVERVEVLRGPQGTLYGRNSVGGTINIVTRQPGNAFESSGRVTVGNYGQFRLEGDASGPLVKNRVMGGVTILRSSRDGFVTDLDHPDHSLGSDDSWAGRGQLRVVFGARSEALISADYSRFEGLPLFDAKPIAAKPGWSFDNPPSLWAVRTSHLASAKDVQQGASARLVVPLTTTMTLTSLTAFRRSNYHAFLDADATELRLQTADVPDLQHQVSQELTLVQRTSKFSWVSGLFLFDDENEGRVEITVFPIATQIRPITTMAAQSRAVFGEATYRASKRVSLTAGLRYTDERKTLDATGGEYRLGTGVLTDPSTFYAFVDAASFHAWTPRASVNVQAADDTFVYASAARGFKSGGFNPGARQPGSGFNPEFAWSYETGLKQTIARGRVRANTAFFYNGYNDLQVQSFIRPGVPQIDNAGAAVIKGIETEAVVTGRGIQVAGHLAWLDAIYDRYIANVPGGATVDAAGNRLSNAPEWSGGVSASYERPVAGRGTASVRGDVSWQSRVFFRPFNNDIESQGRYGLAHLRAGFEAHSRRWDLAVFVRNVGNQAYIIGSENVPIPAYAGHPGVPRHWGTEFTIRP